MALRDLFNKEPAVLLGAAAAVLSGVAEEAASSGASWRSLLPILVSVVIRQFVWSPKSVEETVEEIYASGFVFVKDQKGAV